MMAQFVPPGQRPSAGYVPVVLKAFVLFKSRGVVLPANQWKTDKTDKLNSQVWAASSFPMNLRPLPDGGQFP